MASGTTDGPSGTLRVLREMMRRTKRSRFADIEVKFSQSVSFVAT